MSQDQGFFYDLAIQFEKLAARINEINVLLAKNLNECNEELTRLK